MKSRISSRLGLLLVGCVLGSPLQAGEVRGVSGGSLRATTHRSAPLRLGGDAVIWEDSDLGAPCDPPCGSCCSSGECCPAHGCHALDHGPVFDPHFPPGDLHPHTPYVASPKLYYYFRPYNWYHIPQQQESVMSYGGDPRHPYANHVFKGIYEGLE